MEMSRVLLLIEQYVESLPEEGLSEAYDNAAKDMFTWLRESGCNNQEIGTACSIIQQITGFHPSQIRTSQDAELLKAAVYGSLNSQAIGEDVQRKFPEGNRVQQALAAIRQGFFRPWGNRE